MWWRQMKIKYIGKGTERLIPCREYEVEFSITPRYCWVVVDGYEWTYNDITAFALDWDIIDWDRFREGHEREKIMWKLP